MPAAELERYVRPGPRQVTPLSTPDLSGRGISLRISLRGCRQVPRPRMVRGSSGGSPARLNGGAFHREAGRINRDHLVALGLARQESDNVVRVDGGFK